MHASQRTVSRQADCSINADAVVVAARADGTVDLEFAPRATCGACAGTCLWKRLASSRLEGLYASEGLVPGMAVSVSLPDRQLLAGALLTYGLPLAAILAGAAAGAAIGGSDLGTLAGALLALVLAIAGAGRLRRRLERSLLAGLIVRRRP